MGKLTKIFPIQGWIFRIQEGRFKKGGGKIIQGGLDPRRSYEFISFECDEMYTYFVKTIICHRIYKPR